MISVRLEGRLGNQLFQYAFIYASSKELEVAYYIDKSIEPFLLPRYFNVKKELSSPLDKWLFSIKGCKNLFTYHLRYRFYKYLQKAFSLREIHFSDEISPAYELSKVCNGSMNTGFFQSEDYFCKYKKDIKRLFSVHSKYQIKYRTICDLFPAGLKYIAIHIRRGDYIDLNLALPIAYYHKAIESIHSADNFYIIISDDPDFVKKEFKYLDNKYISRNSEIIDMQLLMGAHTCILSNSSFSWWGAYLNNKGAKIIAPKFWNGWADCKEYPAGILMKNWLLIKP